ncbi:MAG TPA: dTDP-4-dehydrorhamnose 3,5-epimerase family protein [Longimicrobium sp.]
MSEPPELIQDRQTVTPGGDSVQAHIQGLIVRRLRPIEDKRGDITEMYSPAWEVHPDPMVFAYQVTIRPGAIRGWEMHKLQTDRIFISTGAMRWVFYDHRQHSPTHRLLNIMVVSELNRSLIIVPPGVIHAVQNVGNVDAVFINFPTEPYNHAQPDKHRLPLKNSLIPFDFDDAPGW